MNYTFFTGLLQNIALLLVFSFLYATKWVDFNQSLKLMPKILAGLIVGAIGCLLISAPWTYQPGYYIDLRTILLSIAGLYLWGTTTITVVVVMAAFRFFIGGDNTLVGIIIIISSAVVGAAWRYYLLRKGRKITLRSLYIMGLMVHIVMLIIPFGVQNENFLSLVKIIAIPIILLYPFITVLLGFMMNEQLENFKNRKAKEILYESKQRFDGMLADIKMLFINVDLHKNITFCNKYLYSITAYTEEDLIGKNYDDILIPKRKRKKNEKIYKKLLANNYESPGFKGIILTKDNKELHVFWHFSVITDNYGTVTGVASLGENITEEKAIVDNLKKATKKAEESNHLKSVFLQNISHEIRTPMNAIIGSITLLKEADGDEKTQEHFYEVLELGSARLLTTVNNLLDISQVETKQIIVNKTDFSLSLALNNYVDLATPLATKRNNIIKCTSEYFTKDIILHSDSEMLTGIFGNLMSNAVKFTKDGTIEIGSYDENNYIVFYIKDNGIGIPDSRLEVIFDRFVQADSQLSRSYEGSGLGLSIAQAYAKLLGGNIWVESEEGKGSTFFFKLPKDQVTTLNEPQIKEEALKTSVKSSQKILIAEDDRLNFICLRKMIEAIGITILHVKNGAEAVEMVRSDPEISVVLMDIKMPIMSGEEATIQIRNFNPYIPIIAQTAFAMPGDREKFIEIGCDDYISKPIDKNKLIHLIQKYLNTPYNDTM